MLDRDETFARSQFDVDIGYVVLEIDKGFGAVRADVPERDNGGGIVTAARCLRRSNGMTKITDNLLSRANAVVQRFAERESTRGGTDRNQARRTFLHHEAVERIRPDGPVAEMASDTDRWIPAAGNREQVSRNAAPLAVGRPHVNGIQGSAAHVGDHRTGQDLYACPLHTRYRRKLGIGT